MTEADDHGQVDVENHVDAAADRVGRRGADLLGLDPADGEHERFRKRRRTDGVRVKLGFDRPRARVERIVFGAADPKTGACGSVFDLAASARMNHRIDVTGGVLAEESAALLREFFAGRRSEAKKS